MTHCTMGRKIASLAILLSVSIGNIHGAASQSVPEILNILWDNTNGENWEDKSGWYGQPGSYCQGWAGIQCYDVDANDELYGHIETLDLTQNGLAGNLPSSVFAIPHLSQLLLRDNPDLTVSFDGIEAATKLERLVLSRTHIESFQGIEKAGDDFRELHVTGCGYEGTFPMELTQLSQLRRLYANYNNIIGPIPEDIANMIELRELFLMDNNISGSIPFELGLLTNLGVLVLSNNLISGVIQPSLNNLSELQVLALSGNQLRGSLLAFDNLSMIGEIYLQDNYLEGGIPLDFLFNGPKHGEMTIDLSNNSLSGKFTAIRLKEYDYMNIYLSGNKFDSIDEEFCNKDGWMRGDVDVFNCDGILCPVGFYAPFGRQTSEDDICRQCDSTVLGLKFMGSSDCGNEQKTILKGLYDVMGGDNWMLNNWLEELDECLWTGIKCNEEGYVTDIDLHAMGLTGSPPVQMFALPYLKILNFSENFINFQFDGISDATNLRELNLFSTGLKSLEDVEQLAATSLRRLILPSNNLYGTIPDVFWDLPELRELVISHNKFHGILSQDIGNLVNLNVFHAYGNKLSGEIPNTIGNLQESLRHLVLSENDFTGELPEAINFMHVLQDLSIHQTTNTYGGLTGLLPSFSDCYALTSLNLSGNSIGGELPSDFLVNSDHRDDVYIEVDLSSNYFEGHIPQSWNIFSYLNLDLSNNLIDHVASSLCENDYWQDGYLGESENDCNFLLCDRYSYNAQGRATESMPCAHCDSAEYFGATFCQNENVNNLSILEALHASTNGGNWINSLGWFTSNNVCDGWHGIYCDDDGIDIVRIDLSNNGLTGTPSTKLFNLPKLKELSLDENSINFSFDGIGAATKLEVLYLSQTRITSLDGIGKAKSLKELHLTECYLEGPLPHELFSLFNLEAIFMNYNQFSGRIPPAIGQLTKLKKLYLMSNQLTGNIPATIGDLSNLQVLSLTDNAFSGTLPSTLNNLINIEILAIEHERRNKNSIKNRRLLQGVGLTGKLPSFDGLENLQQILLGFNSLTGSIPYSFLDGISDKSQPLKIDLEYNLLEGNVPSSLTQFSEVSVSLQGNKFTGIAPGVCKMTKWNDGDVLDNSCDGILCPINMFSPIGRTSPEAKCESCPAFTASLYLGAIECSTDDEQYEKEEMKILQNLYNNLNGNGWYSQDNWYNEDVSFCLWYGIICAPGETDSIEAIRLPNNDLVGQLPSEIYNLPNLKELNLGGNKIAMTYNGIEKASKLKFMNIDNLGLNNMSGIEASPSLRILHAASNQFVNFPYEVKSLSNLEVLYLSSNKFNIDLPDLSGLTQLSYLECKECALTGKVPSWLGIMTSLQYLSLSGNILTGIIPNELNNLKLLEHLDLSEQTPRGGGLTGELPSFSTLEHLSNLYLNRNKLSGQIDPSFLQNTNVISVSVDLRYNELSGGIPNIFTQRFDDISLLMAENKIDAIPDGCDFDTYDLGWNQGDVRQFGCDALLCEPGFFSPIGRKTSGNRYNCEVCDVAEVDSYYGSTTCGVIPAKVVLESIYNALGGPDWTNNDLWMENDLICEWYGVVCDDNYERVIGLDLENNGLVGPVPSSIYTLTELNMINLKKNKVSFPFGGINQLVNLHSLNLSDNGLESVDGLKEALSLKVLHLTGNSLKSIPDDIYSLVNLEELYMNYNDMEGSISSKIGQLSALRELFMFRNKLSGNIPAEIGKLQNLRTLGLGENSFSGSIPMEINDLPNIETIALQHSRALSQAGPGGPVSPDKGDVIGLTGSLPSFKNSPKLTGIYLGYHDIGGEIPRDFLENVGRNEDIVVDLTMNHISGSLSLSLQRFEYMTIYLAGNEIESIDASFCTLQYWMDGEVEKNGCDAILCPDGTSNQYGRKVSVGPSCDDCAFTFSAPYLGSAECLADANDYNEKEILIKLFDSTDGQNWFYSENWMSDDVDICDWYGVHCTSEEVNDGKQHVKEISLPSNRLAGTIPPQVFDLQYLEVLNLRDNNVDVQLSSLTKEIPTLTSLYLDNTLISSLSGIGKMTNVRTLHLQQNNFLGNPIPEELFLLQKLRRLYISDSNIGGEISSSIRNLSALQEFYCHNNEITGEIPAEIGNLENLKTLVLSENRFVGPLPDLSNMESLQSLLLDSFTRRSAGLSGALPSFNDLPNIREIYLNENSLTGSIPDNFLGGVSNSHERIRVGLKGNRVEGVIPSSLKYFKKLDIDLADNLITSIHPDVCENSYWMGGYVETFKCDAILCPVGYYNQFGRQDNPLVPCQKCGGTEQMVYLGATKCQAEIKKREREVLEILFNQCGGNNWKNKNNWLSDEIDICNWYGIQCNDEGSIDSILLGANNLVGETPRALFELDNLKWLWLYSNPVDFSFHGIGEASSLSSLLLDSTGLTSMDGVGQAYQLVDLEVRFNRLSGPIPDELSHLANLQTLSMSDNSFTGEVPSFNRLHRLKTLRISKNNLTGDLPSFASNNRLRTLDLSDNRIGGTISSDFLEALPRDETVFIDLSRNRITGELPPDLERFDKMTIYLKDNFITAVHSDLCEQSLWNDGDVGTFECNAILCPPGTYAPTRGRESQSSECLSCDKAKYYGQSQCISMQNSASSHTNLFWTITAITISTIAMLA